ncbi:MAG TPA: ornithine cyclodeaminase family protein [Bryobacteraceae bacterium]|nr:ornithine cyclodeaminase family protein [Bryobacteraceae bacterium]
MSDPLWISEQDVVSMMDMPQAIQALEKGLFAEARGEASNMVKTHAEWGSGSTLHAIGAVFPQAGLVGTKTWAHTEKGATPLLILFDSNNGQLKAIIEAFALGQLRTGSASGVATRRLAAENADEFAIIGTGKQAMPQLAAVVAVRPIKRIRVFGRDETRRNLLVKRVTAEFGIETIPAASIEEAVRHVPIATIVTRATQPIVDGKMLDRGTHINAVGAIVPGRAEVAADVLARSTAVVADSILQAQKLSREMIEFFGPDSARWTSVTSLATLVASGRNRASTDDLTLFKSLGMGISDLSLGIELYQRATERGLGRSLPHPQKASPKLRAIQPTGA